MKKFDKRIFRCILSFMLLIGVFSRGQVFADLGPKPTVTVIVKGYDDKDYLLDLLAEDYIDRLKDKPEESDELEMYNYSHEGWRAVAIRTNWVSGSLRGKYESVDESMVHVFGYRPPEKFKIAVRKSDGEFLISNVVEPNQFDAVVVFDMKTGEAKVVKKGLIEKMEDMRREHFLLYGLFMIIILPIMLTAIVEIVIALFFGIKKWGIILWTNVLTQIIIQVIFRGVIDSMDNYYLNLFLIEIGVFVVEYLIYRRFIKSVDKKKIFVYTLVANMATYLAGLIWIKF